MLIKAVLFDMDGTLYDTRLDWLEIRHRIGLPYDGRPILRQLDEAEPELKKRGEEILFRAEQEGAENGVLLPGAAELLHDLQTRGVLCALITNNSRRSVETVLARHPLPFDLVLSRDDGAAKPDPGIFCAAMEQLGVSPGETIAIGDTHLDLVAAQRAGISEIVLVGTLPWLREHIPSDAEYHEATDLVAARKIIERLIGGEAGL